MEFFCEILVAIVFGLENPTLLAKGDIFIPKYTEGVPDEFRLFKRKSIKVQNSGQLGNSTTSVCYISVFSGC